MKNNKTIRMQVLNDGGKIKLIDFLGDDNAVVQAARVSTGKGLKTFEEDKKLIRYLMKNKHTTPFEHVVLKFYIKMPIFIARQWVRHRTASTNEISARYSVIEDSFYVPEKQYIKKQDTKNLQSSKDEVPDDIYKTFIEEVNENNKECYNRYIKAIEMGVARETARILLPLNIYTQMYWTINLHNLFHFIKLRNSSHAQSEMQSYAGVLLKLAYIVCPICCEAFEDFIIHSGK